MLESDLYIIYVFVVIGLSVWVVGKLVMDFSTKV